MESDADKFSRLQQMAANRYGDWDFSDHDTETLEWAVQTISKLAQQQKEESPQTADNTASTKSLCISCKVSHRCKAQRIVRTVILNCKEYMGA